MADSRQVLKALADGGFCSGSELARRLGCSRSAIWKHVRHLREDLGLRIDAVNGRGYRLAQPLELLDRARVLAHVPAAQRRRLAACRIEDCVPSTNALALEAASQVPDGPIAWFAEAQTAGRGRRGRQWHSPYGRNLYFSLLYRFERPLHALAGLSIAVGVELAGLLSACGLRGHGLKWPNDLLWRGGKLAGILIEASGEAQGPAWAVIGVGLNVDLGEVPDWLDQPAADLRGAGITVPRTELAGRLLTGMLDLCETFAGDGLTPFVERWPEYDLLRGQEVCLSGPGLSQRGTVLGLAADGGLRLLSDGREQVFHGGEVSLRLEAEA